MRTAERRGIAPPDRVSEFWVSERRNNKAILKVLVFESEKAQFIVKIVLVLLLNIVQ